MRVLPCFTTDSDTANTSHLSPAHDDVGPSGHVVTLSTQLLEVYAGHRFYRTRCRYRGPWDGRGHSIPIPGSDIYSGRETGRAMVLRVGLATFSLVKSPTVVN
jgi:hypothetical protein